MTDERFRARRLADRMLELLRTGERGGISAQRDFRKALRAIAVELRRIAEAPELAGAPRDARTAGPSLADLLREVGAALDVPVADEPDLERLAAQLDDLVESATGRRAREEGEWMARIHRSAELAIAQALRQHASDPSGTVTPMTR